MITPDGFAGEIDGPQTDGGGPGADGAIGNVTVLASFDPSMGQLAEGLTIQNGSPLVGFAPTGAIVRVQGSVMPFGQIPAPSMTFTTGLAADVKGNVYAAVAAVGATPAPVPGVYKFSPTGGTPTLFASKATPPEMFFANGLDVKGTDLYISDSNGHIFRAPLATGIADVWFSDPLITGDVAGCGGTGFGFAIGANGITHDENNIYVANTDFGRIVRIPIRTNGNPGMPVVVAESCDLHGADGIALDTDGSILLAQNGVNKITRVNQDGTYTVLHEGLDGPASVALELQPEKRLLVTVSAFASASLDGGSPMPALVALPLP